jgi:hypothetical protein
MSTATVTRKFGRGVVNLPASESQLRLLRELTTEIAVYNRQYALDAWLTLRTLQAEHKLTLAVAKHEIATLFDAKASLRKVATEPGTSAVLRPAVPEGRYAVDTDEGHLGFYRVSISETGRITVFVYASDEQHPLPWKAALGVLRKVEAYGIEAAGVRFGVESQRCYRCGKRLTQTHTRAAGIGEKCAAKG